MHDANEEHELDDLAGDYNAFGPLGQFDVNVVIVGYRNGEINLLRVARRLLAAAKAENLTAIATIVLNDDAIMAPLPGISVIHGHGNIGFARAVSIGVDAVSSLYTVIVNPDCDFESESVRPVLRRLGSDCGILIPVLEKAPGVVDINIYQAWVFTPTRRLSAVISQRFLFSSSGERLPRLMKAPGTLVAMETALAHRLNNPFDSSFFLYGEDRDLTFRIRRQRIPITLVREARILHPGGASGTTVTRLVSRGRADGALRVAYRRYGRIGLYFMKLNLLLEAAVKDAVRGSSLLVDTRWAVRRWRGAAPAPALIDADFRDLDVAVAAQAFRQGDS